MEDFLKEWTETARIAESSISPEPVYKDSYAHIASGEDTLITYKLINPQNYELQGSLEWKDGVSEEEGSGYTLAQDSGDRSLFYLTLKNSFLESLDGDGTEISPTLTITEPRSGRNFGSYTVPALVNSAPPAVILPVVLSTGGDAEDETYVICFNLPDMTGIHRDITTLKIGSPYEKTYTVNTNGTLSGGDGGDNWEIKTEYDNSWKNVSDAEFIGVKDNRFVGIVTDVPLSDDLTTFTLTLTDTSGLSTSVKASTQAPKLDSVTASPKGGTIETGGTVTFTGPVSEADIVLTSDNWAGVKKGEEEVSDNQVTGKHSITLTFTTAGTYNITAYAQMSGAADSDKVTFTYKVVDSAVYVSETGNDGNPGTENKPVATLQKAIELLNEAQFNEGKIVVMGTVKTEEVKINTSDGTTGSLKTLTVRGGIADAKLENTSGRVFTIGSGGSLTLGENITLTGTNDTGNGGAVYVAGGTFTMESGSKITGSSAKYENTGGNGGAVYVAENGTFTMKGGAISGNNAGSGVAWCFGGGVYVMNGTFTMEGGTITGNNAMHGGGVRMDSGEFIMKGGTISDNSATILGGGVCVINGSFTMKGGTIGGTDVESANTADYGGGVYMNGGEFTMSGGTIGGTEAGSANTADYGGGVYVNGGEFTMSGGTIGGTEAGSANTADYGGGVYVNTNGRFTMSGNAQIQGNEATGTETVDGGGGGVYVNGGEFTMSDSAVISSNKAVWQGGGVCVGSNAKGIFTMTGGTIGGSGGNCPNTAQFGGGVYMNGSFTVNGNPTITGNTANDNGDIAHNNVYLGTGKTITIGEDFIGGEIGVTAADMTAGNAVQITDKNVDNAASIFTSDVEGYRIVANVKVDGGSTAVFLSDKETSYSTGGNGGVSLADFNDAFGAIENTGGDITVYDTVQITGKTAISPSEGVTINITASGKTTVFDVQAGGILTLGGGDGEVIVTGDPSASPPEADGKEIPLINISSGGTVTIADNANIQNNKAGRGVTVTDGKLIMTGGSIKGNTGGWLYGSGVYVEGSNAEFKMSGGEISGNTLELNNYSTRQGAGVMVRNGATFTLSDSGKITNNSGYEGAGVTVRDSAKFEMNGGEISNNEGSGTSGGVYLVSSATMNMNGGRITGNKAAKTYQGGGAGGVFIGSSCNFTGSTDSTTASIKENYVSSRNVDVYFQSGGNGTYSPGNVQVGYPQNP